MTDSTPPRDPRLRALTSPLRMEILGLFTEGRPLSVADMAERMGRSAPSLYHHVKILAEAGLLREVGPGETGAEGGRSPTLWEAAEEASTLGPADTPEDRAALERIMATAFRMAERDLAAALEAAASEPGTSSSDPSWAIRLHVRLDSEGHRRVVEQLEALLDTLREEARTVEPPTADDRHHSFTLAFLPLAGRNPCSP